jgi:dienelactone hydrolase
VTPPGAIDRVLGVLSLLVLVAVGGCTGQVTSSRPEESVNSGATPAVTSPDLTAPTTTASGPLTFTTTTLTFTDSTRGTVARAPLAATTTRVLHTTIRVPDGSGPWPLVVFGHGYRVSAATYSTLLDGIAEAGFVVAAPEFPGSSSTLPGRPDERDLQDEPCDLRLVAGQVQASTDDATSGLAGKVRSGAVGLAGQSDGATAAAYAALASTCAGPPIGAVVAFSAQPSALRPGLDPADLPALLAVTGSADDVNPPTRTRALFDQFPQRAWLLTTDGEGHLTPSTDSPHLPAIIAIAVDVLRAALDGDPAASGRIAIDAARPGLSLESHP